MAGLFIAETMTVATCPRAAGQNRSMPRYQPDPRKHQVKPRGEGCEQQRRQCRELTNQISDAASPSRLILRGFQGELWSGIFAQEYLNGRQFNRCISHISDVQSHTLDGFVEWRRDKSLKITTGQEGTLKCSSLNKSIRQVRAFWKYLRKKNS